MNDIDIVELSFLPNKYDRLPLALGLEGLLMRRRVRRELVGLVLAEQYVEHALGLWLWYCVVVSVLVGWWYHVAR